MPSEAGGVGGIGIIGGVGGVGGVGGADGSSALMRRTSRRKAGNGFMELDGYRATSAVAGVSSTTASYASTITSLAGVGLGVAEGVSIKRFGSMASLPVRANDIKVRVQSAARADEGGNQHALRVRVQSAAWALGGPG